MKKYISLILVFLTCNVCILANGITISNVSVINNGTNGQIKFDVSWENGWRSSILNNWDAAWIFAKYKLVDGQWNHIYFTLSNNSVPAGFSIAQPAGGEGSFVYRSVPGNGITTITDLRLGIPQNISQGIFDIKVFAIEMVYIPDGSFYLGDASGNANKGFAPIQPTTGLPDYFQPVSINSETIPVNSLYDPNTGASGGIINPPVSFPKGFNAFYSMKYELSQAGYRDFLNSLSYSQQANHTSSAPSSSTGTAALTLANRNYLEIKTPGVPATNTPAVYGCDAGGNNVYDEANDGEWVACNYLNWQDIAAYLAWSALRPMTELEYEKMCRGIMPPVTGEFAWGTSTVFNGVYTLTSAGLTGETVSNASPTVGNAVYSVSLPVSPNNGPLRNGIFATALSDRITSGGGFYGVMELTGNLTEKCVATDLSGLSYTGIHGNGTLLADGYASVANWPGMGPEIDGLHGQEGIINRGGNAFATIVPASTRLGYIAPPAAPNGRFNNNGCRGVRKAP